MLDSQLKSERVPNFSPWSSIGWLLTLEWIAETRRWVTEDTKFEKKFALSVSCHGAIPPKKNVFNVQQACRGFDTLALCPSHTLLGFIWLV